MKSFSIVLGIILILIIGFYLLKWWSKSATGSIGIEQIAPYKTLIQEDTIVSLVLNIPENQDPIQSRLSNLSLHYRMVGESDYKAIQGKQSPLPQKYENLDSKDVQYINYNFYIPSFPQNTKGEIEYYIEFNFDGRLIHSEGVKKIQISDNV